jgi:hypothetical protein
MIEDMESDMRNSLGELYIKKTREVGDSFHLSILFNRLFLGGELHSQRPEQCKHAECRPRREPHLRGLTTRQEQANRL